MNTLHLFKIKFVYKGEKEDGCLEKKKLQVLATCANYTDAESLAMKIIEQEGMAAFECADPEIVRCKINVCNIMLNDVVTANKNLVCGLSELYFENSNDAFFTVKAKIFTEEDKGYREEYLLPAKNGTSAIEIVKEHLKQIGKSSDSFQILSHQIDETEYMYLLPRIIEEKMKENTESE